MKLLKIFAAIFILTMIIFSSVEAAEKPLRVVRLPIIFQSRQPSQDTVDLLETKIARAVHIPLNGTLKLVEYVNQQDSSIELNNLWQKMRAENKKLKLNETIKPLAKNLNADIIVCPVLLYYAEYYIPSGFRSESHLVSDVSAELIIYDGRTDELIDKKTSRSFNDTSSKFGRASYLAAECFDILIEKTNLRKIFMNIGKQGENV